MCEKLSTILGGPISNNSGLSYQVDTETRKKQVVHIQRLMRYEERRDSALVKRVMTVLESDTK